MSDGTHTAAYDFVANWPLGGNVAFTNDSSFQMSATKGYDLLNLLTNIVSTADGGNLVTTTANTNTAGPSQTWGVYLSGRLQGAGGVGGLLMVTHAGKGAHFIAYDGNGNVAALVKASGGSVSANYEYGPSWEILRATYANPPVRQSLGGGGFRFSTKYQDDETDLLYYGYRYYNPSTGRWLSRDPIEEEGGLNLYGFVENDAVSRVDALGEKIIIIPFPIPIPIPVPTSEWELKRDGYLFWRTFKVTSPHWQEVMDDWFWEKLPSRTFTGISDPRNKDIAGNIGFLKLLRCVLAKKRGLSVPSGRWEVGYKDFQWQYTLTKAEAAGGEAAFTPATEFLGSYRAEVRDKGPVAAGQSTVHKLQIHVKNISDWYSATRIPGRFGGGSIWPSHPQHDTRYKPRQSIGGTFPNDYDFEVEEDVCNAKCELP